MNVITLGLCYQSSGPTNFSPKTAIKAVEGLRKKLFLFKAYQASRASCSKTETAFAMALCISIHVNIIKQEFSHLNCPLAYFTIVISWDFLLRRELHAWRNRPFVLVS